MIRMKAIQFVDEEKKPDDRCPGKESAGKPCLRHLIWFLEILDTHCLYENRERVALPLQNG
jgi:hypothetical protein